VLSSFSPQAVIFTKNPSYWQAGLPKVDKLDFPAFDSNTSANLALEQGTLDWGGNFVQDIQKAYIDKDPATNHFWDAPVQTETLIPNLTVFRSTTWPSARPSRSPCTGRSSRLSARTASSRRCRGLAR
jgi:peptide/nickel transport system substrate-binding protein